MNSPAPFTATDVLHMQRALQLAREGEGFVEPNPMVGCVIAHGERVVGEGWHQAFGEPHAEIHALRQAGEQARGATLYVTLEPCSHTGKTPPCAEAVIDAGIARVVVAHGDPHPRVAGGGIRRLQAAGIEVQTGLLTEEAAKVLAPFLMLTEGGRPWVIAKWAMTLDGKIATATGDSQWISGEASRKFVHQLRGRVDGIMVGGGTARHDDPLLTARPPGARVATRIVVTGTVDIDLDSQLVRTADEMPLLCVTSDAAPPEDRQRLTDHAAEVVSCGPGPRVDLSLMLRQLGERQMTNLLVEGGGELLGALFDDDLIDEVHVFIAPKLLGGKQAATPLAGRGIDSMALARQLIDCQMQQTGDDLYLSGRVQRD